MRRLRAGTSFEEFGAAPIALDFYLDAFDGPTWAIKPFQQRSGWLMVVEARFPMPFIIWKRTLIACITDHGEVFSAVMANVVFSMPTSLPRVLEDYTPDALDEVMGDLYRSFLKRTEQDNLDHLGEAQERTQVRVSMFESECRALENQIAQAIRGLRTARRQGDVSRETQQEIDAKLKRFSAMADTLGPIMRDRIRDMRSADDMLESAVMASFGRPGTLEHRYTVRWRAVSRRTAVTIKVPLYQEDSWSADSWKTRRLPSPVGWGINQRSTFE
ncbi:MAG: hypothetical protein DI527_09035 [Chelatococcus sp.]|nr:MAG: hypothetical protein DI527_09035 [Chelatococcus sp.]